MSQMYILIACCESLGVSKMITMSHSKLNNKRKNANSLSVKALSHFVFHTVSLFVGLGVLPSLMLR